MKILKIHISHAAQACFSVHLWFTAILNCMFSHRAVQVNIKHLSLYQTVHAGICELALN